MKLIAILRDPVERAFSAWKMYRRFGLIDYRPEIYAPRRETREFDEAVCAELEQLKIGAAPLEPGYIAHGLYYQQLQRYLDVFQRDQILVLESSELRRDPARVVVQTVAFLDLPDHEFGNGWPLIHVGEDQAEIPDAARQVLRRFYRPHNESLYELLGRDFGWE
jgi:hypothetical protein